MKHVILEKISLKNHDKLNEKWVQELIADDPSILNLGINLACRGKEIKHLGAGRLDLLLSDDDSNSRYEVEIQLGKTDESHIIRTIEYWDIERRRSPKYQHCAVIIAEDITSRFLNVISLFNGYIPLIALQMTAYKVGEDVSLTFTKIVDKFNIETEEEEATQILIGKEIWASKRTSEIMNIIDGLSRIVNEAVTDCETYYTKSYIGFKVSGLFNNFCKIFPNKTFVWVRLKMNQNIDFENETVQSGLQCGEYNALKSQYKFKILQKDIGKYDALLKKYITISYTDFAEMQN